MADIYIYIYIYIFSRLSSLFSFGVEAQTAVVRGVCKAPLEGIGVRVCIRQIVIHKCPLKGIGVTDL